MLGHVAGILLIVTVVAAAVGFVYGMGWLGYKLNGEPLGGVFFGCVALYVGGKWVWRNLLKPITADTHRWISEQAPHWAAEMERSGQVVLARRHRGKSLHRFKFACSRCAKHNVAVAAMDERYTVSCMHCGFPHRLFFKSWW